MDISGANIDGIVCFLHGGFLLFVVSSLLLQWLMETIVVRRLNPPPICTPRTVLMLSLIALQALILLTDILPTLPRRTSSYVVTLFSVASTSACLFFRHAVGNVRPLPVAIVLLVYWFLCAIFQAWRQSSLGLTSDMDVSMHLETCMLMTYLALIVTECLWIIKHVSM